MSLSTLAAADRAAMVDPDAGFGERVLYRPAGIGSTPREMYATVRRYTPEPVAGTKTSSPHTDIAVSHEAIGAATIDTQADRFDVADKPGGELVGRQVVKAIADAGGWMITLR